MSVPKETTPETMPEAVGEAAAGAAPTAPLAAPPNDGCGGTPWQTPGPYPPINDQADKDLDLTHIQGHANRAKGQVIYIKGRILDDHFHPVSGAIVLIWQADHNGVPTMSHPLVVTGPGGAYTTRYVPRGSRLEAVPAVSGQARSSVATGDRPADPARRQGSSRRPRLSQGRLGAAHGAAAPRR